MRRNTSQKGFTLIELLIVIAIIGILAAVLIPNLLAARERAFDAAAQACAKEIITGAEIWAIDNPNAGYTGYTVPATGTAGACLGLTESVAVTSSTLYTGSVTSRSGATVTFGNIAPMVTTRP